MLNNITIFERLKIGIIDVLFDVSADVKNCSEMCKKLGP